MQESLEVKRVKRRGDNFPLKYQLIFPILNSIIIHFELEDSFKIHIQLCCVIEEFLHQHLQCSQDAFRINYEQL